eukprot:g20027.t1
MSELKGTLDHVKQKCRNKAFELKQLENYRGELIRQKQTSARACRRKEAATKRYRNAKQKSALLVSDSEDDTFGALGNQGDAAGRGKKKANDVAASLDVEDVRAPMPGTDGVKDTVRRMPLPAEDEDELEKFLLGDEGGAGGNGDVNAKDDGDAGVDDHAITEDQEDDLLADEPPAGGSGGGGVPRKIAKNKSTGGSTTRGAGNKTTAAENKKKPAGTAKKNAKARK